MVRGGIRWKKGDYISLGKAVSSFNKKIRELQKEENKTYLPNLVDYKEIKDEINTRRELNRYINSLKRFMRTGVEQLYETEAGEQITKWERRELGINIGIATRKLNKELATLSEPTEVGFSRAEMGNSRVREIQAQLRNLHNIERAKGYEFNLLRLRAKRYGATDYEWKMSKIYRENYLKEMEKYRNFEGYDKLINTLYQITNPIEFYRFVSRNELTR